jgi:hypothetical protein
MDITNNNNTSNNTSNIFDPTISVNRDNYLFKILDYAKNEYPNQNFKIKPKKLFNSSLSDAQNKMNNCENIYNVSFRKNSFKYPSQFPKLIKTFKNGIFKGGRTKRKMYKMSKRKY